jgi:hypothetical protein
MMMMMVYCCGINIVYSWVGLYYTMHHIAILTKFVTN